MLKVAWSPIYHHPLPENHRFPMAKYSLLPKQLIHEGVLTEEQFFEPDVLDESFILRTHSSDYWNQLHNLTLPPKAQRRIGFPLTESLVLRERIICQGTIDTALYALENGCSLNIAGGTHHAFRDHGEGFCLLNDLVIASHYLLDHLNFKRILIIDLDVHQGNGTAALCQNEPRIFTFSMHGANNYPLHKQESDIDIALPDQTSGSSYLAKLESILSQTIEMQQPEFIFYQSGVDVLTEDKLGRLSLTIDDCKRRDEVVLSACSSLEIPISVTMGGGYSPRIATILEAHTNTFKTAQYFFE